MTISWHKLSQQPRITRGGGGWGGQSSRLAQGRRGTQSSCLPCDECQRPSPVFAQMPGKINVSEVSYPPRKRSVCGTQWVYLCQGQLGHEARPDRNTEPQRERFNTGSFGGCRAELRFFFRSRSAAPAEASEHGATRSKLDLLQRAPGLLHAPEPLMSLLRRNHDRRRETERAGRARGQETAREMSRKQRKKRIHE